MQVQRRSSKRHGARGCGIVLIATGLALLVLLGAVLLSPALPAIALRLFGFTAIQQTAAPAAPAAPTAAATLANAVKGMPVEFISGDYGPLALPPSVEPQASVGQDAAGARALHVVLRDRDLQSLCLHFTGFCSDRGSPLRQAQVLVGGGRITVRGEAYLDLINRWQGIEITLEANSGNRLQIASISLGGTRYALPDNALGRRLRAFETEVARMLDQLQAASSDEVFSFAGFDLRDNQLIAIFR